MVYAHMSRREALARAALTATSLSLAVSISTAAKRVEAKVSPTPDADADNDVLNALLTAEYDAIATYTAGAGIIAADGAADQPTKDTVTAVAVHFRSQHMEHAAALRKLIEDNDGDPVADSGEANIPESFDDPTVGGVIKLAADKEKQAAVAYANVMKSISTLTAAKLVASIGAVETQHFVVLYLLAEGLIAANADTLTKATLVVPAAFILDVGGSGTQSLEDFPDLDDLLELDPPS